MSLAAVALPSDYESGYRDGLADAAALTCEWCRGSEQSEYPATPVKQRGQIIHKRGSHVVLCRADGIHERLGVVAAEVD